VRLINIWGEKKYKEIANLPPSWEGAQAYSLEASGKELTLVPFADGREYWVWLRRQ
jgi:hypothetical protein